jgi:hypothetical protein
LLGEAPASLNGVLAHEFDGADTGPKGRNAGKELDEFLIRSGAGEAGAPWRMATPKGMLFGAGRRY